MTNIISKIYRQFLTYPIVSLAIMLALTIACAYFAKDFNYEASADTLVAENDPSLAYYREVSEEFGGEEFMFLTYAPTNVPLFSRTALDQIEALAAEISKVDGVAKVTTILDAPLLKSSNVPITELAEKYKTLRAPEVDIGRAIDELRTSPFFKNLLVAEDGSAAAFHIALVQNERLEKLRVLRDKFRNLEKPTAEQKVNHQKTEAAYRAEYQKYLATRDTMLSDLREIRDNVKDATVHLGGVPMVAADMISYVKSDVAIFGLSATAIVMLALFAFFRRVRWVILPIATAGATIVLTMGVLGYIHQAATVISSNFVAILAILSISFTIHLIVKYREILRDTANSANLSTTELVHATMADKFAPCFYTALTTFVAFASLVTSEIIPVIDFGFIMCVGICISFLVAYTLFPLILVMLPKEELPPSSSKQPIFTSIMCKVSTHQTNLVIITALITAAISLFGMSKLSLENRFLDYFNKNTEVFQSLSYIDATLGGTVPMDIIVKFPPFVEQSQSNEDDDFAMDDFAVDDFGAADDPFPERYWFTPDKIQVLEKFHQFLEAQPAIGKILSLSTLEKTARVFVGDKPLSGLEIAAVLSKLPPEIRANFIEPYAAPEKGLMRISTRIHEAGVDFSRDQLIKDIENFGNNELGLEEGDVQLTGMNVLFNNMLRELFSSQAYSFLFIIGAIFVMFIILLRSFTLAILGVVPNILAAFIILAYMGYAGIPLDMMTITIAAIVMGIGVDDTIHYLHRLKEELAKGEPIKEAINQSHANIGNALYFTSLTVVIGFSVLALSNFVPTVHFGLLTVLAMLAALVANLSVLPSLVLRFYQARNK